MPVSDPCYSQQFIINLSRCSVYLGVNDKKVDYLNTQLLGDKRYEYGVDWGIAHPKYLEFQVSEGVGHVTDEP